MAKVKKTKTCWLWTGCIDKYGYGRFQDGYSKLAHRWIMEHVSQRKLQWDSDARETVNHRCNTPSCVKPAHLYVGDQKQNVRDALAAGTHRNLRATSECKYGHSRDDHGYTSNQGHMMCRPCIARRNREARQRRMLAN